MIVDNGVVPHLVTLLQRENASSQLKVKKTALAFMEHVLLSLFVINEMFHLKRNVVHTLGSIAKGHDRLVQVLINSGAVRALLASESNFLYARNSR